MEEKDELTLEEYKEYVNKDDEQKRLNYIMAELSTIELVLEQKGLIKKEEFDECVEVITNKIIKRCYDKLSEQDKKMIKSDNELCNFFGNIFNKKAE